MKCFYHHDKDAVALCKSCNRAVCSECAADVPPGTACLNRCEMEVAALNLVIQRSKTAYRKTGQAYKRNAVATLAAGIVFIVMGGLPIIVNRNYGASFMVILGFVFLLWAYFNYRNGKQIESTSDAQQQVPADVFASPSGRQSRG